VCSTGTSRHPIWRDYPRSSAGGGRGRGSPAGGTRSAAALGELQRRHAAVELGRQADPYLEVERAGYLVCEEPAHGPAVDAADELAAEPSVGEGVVAEARSRVLAGGLRREQRAHVTVVRQLLDGDRTIDSGQSCGVRNDVADEDVRLFELRPVTLHRGVQLEVAAVDEDQHAHRGEPFRAGEDQLKRVFRPGTAGAAIGDSAPEVDHDDAIDGHNATLTTWTQGAPGR
jgi:hypothetical protein